MTSREMLALFQELLITTDPSFKSIEKLDSIEIYSFLNYSQRLVFKERYFPTPSIVQNTLIINSYNEELKELFDTTILVGKDDPNDPGDYMNISDPNLPISYIIPINIPLYAHYVRSNSKVVRVGVFPTVNESGDILPNKLITYNEVESHMTTPLHSPIIRKPAVLIENGEHVRVFVDKYTTSLKEFHLTYLKYPALIGDTQNCELIETLHVLVVNTAVNLFKENKYLLRAASQNQAVKEK